MTRQSIDRFADDYIELLLSLVEQIERDEMIHPASVHATLLRRLTNAKEHRHGGSSWEHAIYALVSLTDELMLETPWEGRSWWNDHVLEVSLFGTRLCSERFFTMANDVARDPNDGTLRLFHDCVLLGFRGVYAITELGESITKELGIPPTLEQWLARTQQGLLEESPVEFSAKLHRPLTGAAPNSDRRNIVWWAVATCAMLLANVTVFGLLLRP